MGLGPALAEAGYRVVFYDRRGFGRSSQPFGGYDYDTLADDLAEVLEQTGARDATIVGFSMGGGEVARYFSRHGGKSVVKAGLVSSVAGYLLKDDSNPDGVDESVFEDADSILVDRPNARRHLAFGHGIHRCVGARLAELQISVLLEELAARRLRVNVAGEPERVAACFVHGYRKLPVEISRY